MKSENYIISESLKWEQCGEGVVRQIMGYNRDLMLVKVKFDKGSIGVLHSHPHSQSSYVSEGSFEVTIGGDVRVLKKGDGYFVAPDIVHGVKCLEDGIIIDVFSPYREDFLQ